jgi:hypothetical protein
MVKLSFIYAFFSLVVIVSFGAAGNLSAQESLIEAAPRPEADLCMDCFVSAAGPHVRRQ